MKTQRTSAFPPPTEAGTPHSITHTAPNADATPPASRHRSLAAYQPHNWLPSASAARDYLAWREQASVPVNVPSSVEAAPGHPVHDLITQASIAQETALHASADTVSTASTSDSLPAPVQTPAPAGPAEAAAGATAALSAANVAPAPAPELRTPPLAPAAARQTRSREHQGDQQLAGWDKIFSKMVGDTEPAMARQQQARAEREAKRAAQRNVFVRLVRKASKAIGGTPTASAARLPVQETRTQTVSTPLPALLMPAIAHSNRGADEARKALHPHYTIEQDRARLQAMSQDVD